ncbi:MAG: hypothetical protein ACT4NY_09035 [Pseudonocardiales bacterium]
MPSSRKRTRRKAQMYRWDDYVAEADNEAFVLDTGDMQIIILPPTAEAIIDIEESDSTRDSLELLCGEQWDAVWELIRDQPGSVLQGLVCDMGRHFGISGEARPPVGGRVSSR